MNEMISLKQGHLSEKEQVLGIKPWRQLKNYISLVLQLSQKAGNPKNARKWVAPRIFSWMDEEDKRMACFYKGMGEKGIWLNPDLFGWLQNQNKVGFLLMNNNMDIISWNGLSSLLLGISPLAASQSDWKNAFQTFKPYKHTAFPLEELPMVKAQINGLPVEEVDMLVDNRKMGIQNLIRLSATPISFNDGQNAGSLAFFRKIDEREYYYKALIASSKEAVLLIDRKERIEFVSQSAKNVMGVCPQDLTQLPIREVISQWKTISHDSYSGPQKIEFEMKGQGSEKLMEGCIFPQRFLNLKGKWILRIRDISIEKEEQLLLKSLQKKVDKYAFLVSHELREPIVNILGLTQLLELEKKVDEKMIGMLKDLALKLDHLTRKASDALSGDGNGVSEFP